MCSNQLNSQDGKAQPKHLSLFTNISTCIFQFFLWTHHTYHVFLILDCYTCLSHVTYISSYNLQNLYKISPFMVLKHLVALSAVIFMVRCEPWEPPQLHLWLFPGPQHKPLGILLLAPDTWRSQLVNLRPAVDLFETFLLHMCDFKPHVLFSFLFIIRDTCA